MINEIIISTHYEEKHSYLDDEIILELVRQLDNKRIEAEEQKDNWEYFSYFPLFYQDKIYKMVWCFENNSSFLGVRTCYRYKKYEKKSKLVKFPNDREIIKKLSDPNHEGNFALNPNASPLEKSKYELCQSILAYKQDKKVSTENLVKKIQLSTPETNELLFCHIDKFTVDRLITYATNLGINLQIKEASSNLSRSVKNFSRNISLSRKTSNGRLKKHL